MANRRQAAGMATTLIVLAVAGCSTPPHSDVLIFGTQTKVALDVSSSVENAQMPEVTIGYKRKEFVWMPLHVNGKEARKVEPGTDGNTKYVGTSTRSDDKNQGEDTYSVLASFGAEVSGKGEGGAAEGTVGLAQYFATGHAARILAGSGGDLVNVNAPSQAVLKKTEQAADDARQDAEAARAQTNMILKTQEDLFKVIRETEGKKQLELIDKRSIVLEWLSNPDGTIEKTRLSRLLDGMSASVNTHERDNLEKASEDRLRFFNILRTNSGLVLRMFSQVQAEEEKKNDGAS